MSSTERLLLSFVLECSAANEPGAVSVAFKNYLQLRLHPEAISLLEEGDLVEQMKPGELVQKIGDRNYYILPMNPPLVVDVVRPKDGALETFETDAIYRAVKLFVEKYKTVVDLRGLTYTDDVTGLFNQRYLETVLERELALAKRNGNAFSVLFLDLDHFKQINDKYGHLIGSRILCEVGDEIRRTLRESDLTFRFGGDEFVCVLSHTNLVEATTVAERVRQRVEKKNFLANEDLNIHITSSIGVASYPEHALTREEILNAADEALYGSKGSQRNCVIQAVAVKR